MTTSIPSKIWEVRLAGPKGLGVFAKSHIPRGTRIFSERPLLALKPSQGAGDIYSSARLLPLEDRKSLMRLSTYVTKGLSVIRWNQAIWYTIKYVSSYLGSVLKGTEAWTRPRNHSIKEHVALLSIFRSNAFNLGSGLSISEAVFPRISRINHSCVPNAQGNFHGENGVFNIHATRDIAINEEVTLSYLPEFGAVREKRVEKLKQGYGFECGCAACDLSEEAGEKGEQRRVAMQLRLEEYATSVAESSLESKEAQLETMESFIELLEGEGIAGRELASLYMEVTKLKEGFGKHEEALKSAERALEIDEACLGTDHPTYQVTRETVEILRRVHFPGLAAAP